MNFQKVFIFYKLFLSILLQLGQVQCSRKWNFFYCNTFRSGKKVKWKSWTISIQKIKSIVMIQHPFWKQLRKYLPKVSLCVTIVWGHSSSIWKNALRLVSNALLVFDPFENVFFNIKTIVEMNRKLLHASRSQMITNPNINLLDFWFVNLNPITVLLYNC